MDNEAVRTAAAGLFPGGVNSPVRSFRSVGGKPVPIARGTGAFVFDAEGRSYIDYLGAFGPLILGHTDQLGSAAYNQDLSERRASAAASYLVSQGLGGTRIATRGLGETEAVATNTTEAGRQANRRVEVAIFASKEARAAAGGQGTR